MALPPENADHFVEKLLLMPSSCIVNDYMTLRGEVLKYTGENRASRDALRVKKTIHLKWV